MRALSSLSLRYDGTLEILDQQAQFQSVEGSPGHDGLINGNVATGAGQTVRSEHCLDAGVAIHDLPNRRRRSNL